MANPNQTQDRRQNNNQAPAVITELAPPRLVVAPDIMKQLAVTPGEWRVLVDQLYPAAKSVEAVQLVLTYCKSRGLDPMKKPVHIVPVYSSLQRRMVETVWPGISELRTTATRTGAYAGITEAEYGPDIEREFIQTLEDDRDPRAPSRQIKHTVRYPEWCRMTVYRMVQNVKCAFQVRVFWLELYATAGRNTDMPNEMWRKRPFGQIEKCCEAAGLRKAFPEELGGEYAAEEMSGRIIDDDFAIPETKTTTSAPRAPRPSDDGDGERGSPSAGRDNQEGKASTPPRADGRRSERVNLSPDGDNKSPAGDKPSPNGDKRKSPVGDKVIEGELLPPDDANAAFFMRLEAELLATDDETSFEEAWDKADALAKFDGDEALQRRALEVRRNALTQLLGS